MPKTLKQTLTQAIRMMYYDLAYLESSLQPTTDLQTYSLTTLSTGIDELLNSTKGLPRLNDPLHSSVRHDIRNRLTIISGYAQLLLDKRHSPLDATTRAALENILDATKHINEALTADKACAAEHLKA